MNAKNGPALSCVRCGTGYPWSFMPECAECGALVDVNYDLEHVRIAPDGPPMKRFFDLLPLQSRENIIDGGEGNTPCIHAEELGPALGLKNLYLKLEGENPTRTTKDRQGTMVVATFRELGIRRFVTSSTGNSCTALARMVSRFPEVHMSIFVGDEFLQRVNWPKAPNVDIYWLKNGTFVEAHEAAGWFARQNDIVAERGFFSFAKREALKGAYLEAVDQVPKPIEVYVQSVSSAMGVYATWKGSRQYQALGRIKALPQLVCVQEETCNPMVRAWQRGSEHIEEGDVVSRPWGYSKATLRGDPRRVYPYIQAAVRDSNGTMTTARQEDLLRMQAMAKELQGVDICPTSAMTLAAVSSLCTDGWFDRNSTILCNMTGAERPPQPVATADYIVTRDGKEWKIVPASGSEEQPHQRVMKALQQLGFAAGMDLREDTQLLGGGLGLDSVALLQFSLELEKEYGCEIDPAEMTPANFSSIASVTRLMQTKAGSRPG